MFGASPKGEKNPGIKYETKQLCMNILASSGIHKWKFKKFLQG